MSLVGSSLRRFSPAAVSRRGVRRFSVLAGVACCGGEAGKGASSSVKAWLAPASGVVLVSGLGFGLWSSSSHVSYADFAAPPGGTIAGAEQVEEPPRRTRYLFGDSYRRRIFFNYEKRIRTQSPPEKVFEYFASHVTSSGEMFMTPADLMRAVVAVFPPSESNLVREGYLKGERSPGDLRCAPSSFFMLFDTNNDGLISFPEYIFFVTLLSIPEASFSVAFKMFDLDHNGEIQREEFKKVMALMRSYNRQGACHCDGRRHGFKVERSVENGGLLEYFFGKDGSENLQHDKFVNFLKDLHNEEFKSVAELRKKLKPLSIAIFGYGKINGLLTKEDFQRATSHVCGVTLTDNVVDIIYHVFDVNSDGNLSSEEFFRVLQKRERGMARPSGTSVSRLFSCCLNCAKNSWSSVFY